MRVRAFATCAIPETSPAFSSQLRRLRQEHGLARHAWVTLWGLRAVHRLRRLPSGPRDELEAQALHDLHPDLSWLEIGGAEVVTAQEVSAERRVGATHVVDVSTVAASQFQIRQRIRPLVDAGFEVQGVSTPAMALAAVARHHHDLPAQATAAYVACTPRATCIALVRDGMLLVAREMPWGHATPGEPLLDRLVFEIRRSVLFFGQSSRAPVEAVVLCGDVPALRALTAPLEAGVGVPVQTLDSLAGIDAEHPPAPADLFRAEVAALRLALATAGAATPPPSLLPARVHPRRRARRSMGWMTVAVAGGALVVAGWYSIVRWSGADRADQVRRFETRVADMEARALEVSSRQRAAEARLSRQAALAAFASEGPRAARLLEAVSQAAPADVALDDIDLRADGDGWRLGVRGTSLVPDVAAGQAALQRLLDRLAASPFVGAADAPSVRVLSGGGGGVANPGTASFQSGVSGVEFDLSFRVER